MDERQLDLLKGLLVVVESHVAGKPEAKHRAQKVAAEDMAALDEPWPQTWGTPDPRATRLLVRLAAAAQDIIADAKFQFCQRCKKNGPGSCNLPSCEGLADGVERLKEAFGMSDHQRGSELCIAFDGFVCVEGGQVVARPRHRLVRHLKGTALPRPGEDELSVQKRAIGDLLRKMADGFFDPPSNDDDEGGGEYDGRH